MSKFAKVYVSGAGTLVVTARGVMQSFTFTAEDAAAFIKDIEATWGEMLAHHKKTQEVGHCENGYSSGICLAGQCGFVADSDKLREAKA